MFIYFVIRNTPEAFIKEHMLTRQLYKTADLCYSDVHQSFHPFKIRRSYVTHLLKRLFTLSKT